MNLDSYKKQFDSEGYCVVPSLFSRDEVAGYIEHFMHLNEEGNHAFSEPLPDPSHPDPLKRFPRMIQMHREDSVSLKWLIDSRLNEVMTHLLGNEPLAVQTMMYFKPPGGRGQALHQDQYFLRVQPGTCMAAWMALDFCDEENGCMRVVPGSHKLPVLCTVPADMEQSFVDITVPLPPGSEALPVVMKPGDVLFFNGSVIHGSYPNVSKDRFRRALIGHYIDAEAEKVAKFYHPVLHMDGSPVDIEISTGGGPCGVFTDKDGETTVELVGHAAEATMRHG